MGLTKTTIVLLAGFALMAGPVAFASPITPPGTVEQLAISSLGAYAELDVDAIGFVTCLDVSAGADCGTLNFLPFIAPHTDLTVTTKPLLNFGGFIVSVTGRGGASAVPSLQNLADTNNFIGAGASTFTTLFTDTDYCGAPGFTGGCFGPKFTMQMTNNPDPLSIPTASTTFSAFVSPGSTIPAGSLINTPAGTTVVGCCGFLAVAANPIGSTFGSLSTEAVTTFPGAGSVQTTFNIGAGGTVVGGHAFTLVPEPSSFALFGIAAGFVALKLRRRKG